VHVVTVPDVLIEIHPEWRGHQYFVARDEIVIVDSGHRIIATLPLGSSSSAQMEGSRGGGTQSATETEINLSSDEIRHMQIVLKEKGFDIGEPDGIFGPKTRQALILFQERNGVAGQRAHRCTHHDRTRHFDAKWTTGQPSYWTAAYDGSNWRR
jgi:peptidoglycan hydrolase-like protein with peptidoglycan-binding domain